MRLFINGGGSGKQTELTYQEINKIIDHNKPILYVPLAMEESQYSLDECYHWIKDEVSVIDVPSIEMVKSFDELSEKDFNDYAFMFFGGGRTCRLLKGLKSTNNYDKLKDYIYSNGIVYGSSAGGVIFGKRANSVYIMDPNEVGLEDTTGYNLLNDYSLFMHYTNYRARYTPLENETLTEVYTDFIVKYTKENEKIIALPEEDTIYFDGENIQLIGESPYYLFENGEKRKVYKR